MTEEKNIEKFNEIFSRVLQVNKTSITDSMSPISLPAWDSFNTIMLVAELEKGFGMRFTMDEVVTTKNVGDIKINLQKHGVLL